MLRECRRILKPGGTVVGVSIHTPQSLTPAQEERAVELGPSLVCGCESPEELISQAGFSRPQVTDVTFRFRHTCLAWLTAMKELESQLRTELGDEDFEDELDQKESMLTGIDEGLLLRSLIIGERL
ncbi:MAG TPA: hypothetical protein EYO20_07335 [Gemmatimonadetes bacterium]|nr:hypothetical protein [Gemmatimonadota bacterium]HIC13530.1 hypothetical protein [Gemmatimonadota bacterium]HIN77832.1 hypothetical protein [Gemmatimonadota bacterium]